MEDFTTKENITFPYQIDQSPIYIIGHLGHYDNSGYKYQLDYRTAENFYRDIDRLNELEWVDENTLSLRINMSLFNKNLNVVFLIRALYEGPSGYFKTYKTFGIVDLDPKFDVYLIFAIIFSIGNLIFHIVDCRLNENQKQEMHRLKDNDLANQKFPMTTSIADFKTKIKMYFWSFKWYFKCHYRPLYYYEYLGKFI